MIILFPSKFNGNRAWKKWNKRLMRRNLIPKEINGQKLNWNFFRRFLSRWKNGIFFSKSAVAGIGLNFGEHVIRRLFSRMFFFSGLEGVYRPASKSSFSPIKYPSKNPFILLSSKETTLERADLTLQQLMLVTAEKERRMFIIFFLSS